MASKNSWLIENRVILSTFSGEVSLEDLQAHDLDMLKHIEAGEAPVHVVCDITAMVRYPSNIAAITRSARQHLTHPNMGWFIATGMQNPFLSFIADIVANTSYLKLKLKKAHTIEEALDMLQQVDTRLASSSINTSP